MDLPLPSRRICAFTLLELLIVIAIIAVLASVIVGVSQSAIRSGDRVQGMSCMRQMGLAMQSYANDHNDTMPGPFWAGQAPWYATSDPNSLGTQLWSYMGAPKPQPYYQECTQIESRAYLRVRPTPGSYCYIINSGFNQSGIHYNPFGYPNSAAAPMRESLLSTLGITNQFAIQDMDQTNAPTTASWYKYLPTKPIYGPFRLTLYFDWHASFDKISTK